MALVRLLAGSRITRVPFSKIRTIGSAVELEVPGEAVGLNKSEDRAERWIPHKGAL